MLIPKCMLREWKGKNDLAFPMLGKYPATHFIWGTLSSRKENNPGGGLLLGLIYPALDHFFTQVWPMKGQWLWGNLDGMKTKEPRERASAVAGENGPVVHWTWLEFAPNDSFHYPYAPLPEKEAKLTMRMTVTVENQLWQCIPLTQVIGENNWYSNGTCFLLTVAHFIFVDVVVYFHLLKFWIQITAHTCLEDFLDAQWPGSSSANFHYVMITATVSQTQSTKIIFVFKKMCRWGLVGKHHSWVERAHQNHEMIERICARVFTLVLC